MPFIILCADSYKTQEAVVSIYVTDYNQTLESVSR